MTSTKAPRRLADASLFIAALIWGTGFIASQMAIDSGMSYGLIMLIRFAIATGIIGFVFRKHLTGFTHTEIKHGIIAGVILFGAFYIQTVGLSFTTPSNNAFFTATNVMMVPFLAWFVLKKKPEAKSFICAVLCFIGMAVLSISNGDGFRVNPGDALTLLAAVFFAGHIVALTVSNEKVDYRKLAFLQVAVTAILSLIVFLTIDIRSFTTDTLVRGLPSVIYLGVLSSCIAFFIKTWALKYTAPAKASLIISTEAVFGSIFSIMLGFEMLTFALIIGGALILFSVILTEVNILNRRSAEYEPTLPQVAGKPSPDAPE